MRLVGAVTPTRRMLFNRMPNEGYPMSFQEIDSVEQLESAIETEDNVMVVFSKDQCPACTTMGQWLDKQFVPESNQSGIKVVLAKLERVGRKVVEDFGLRTMPTTLLFKGGDEVYRVTGFQGPQPVNEAVNTHLLAI